MLLTCIGSAGLTAQVAVTSPVEEMKIQAKEGGICRIRETERKLHLRATAACWALGIAPLLILHGTALPCQSQLACQSSRGCREVGSHNPHVHWGWMSTTCFCLTHTLWLHTVLLARGMGRTAGTHRLSPRKPSLELEGSGWNEVFVIKLLSTEHYLEECPKITKWKMS